LGPGHGKVLAVSYFLHRDAPPKQALIYAYLSMPLHVLSATGLVLGGKYILEMSASRAVDDMGRVLQDVSYGLLAAMGLLMLVSALRNCRGGSTDPESRPKNGKSSKGLFGLALATGLVPCPGAALVLIFSIALGITGAGMAAMVAIALGMGLCLATVSLLTIRFRRTALALMQNRSPLLHAGQCAFSLTGAAVVLATGTLLLTGSLLR
jgi:ABC-type nickel/cobalt efflux system permease component RcnA